MSNWHSRETVPTPKHPEAAAPYRQPDRPGTNGRKRCRWCWGNVKPPKRTFCSAACVLGYRLEVDWNLARRWVEKRDGGVCALCDTDTEWLENAFWHGLGESLREIRVLDPKTGRETTLRRLLRFALLGRRHHWEADHILQRAEGGSNQLSNLRTLCGNCHARETSAYARERARRRREGRMPAERIQFEVYGDPEHTRRARAMAFRPKGAKKWKARVYDAGETDTWKFRIKQALLKEGLPRSSPWRGPVRCDIVFFLHRPKKYCHKKYPAGPIAMIEMPDRDNLDKAVLDALTRAGLWIDDKRVFTGTITKLYHAVGAEPGAIIAATHLEGVQITAALWEPPPLPECVSAAGLFQESKS